MLQREACMGRKGTGPCRVTPGGVGHWATVIPLMLISHLFHLRVPTVLRVPRVWLVRGASLVCLGNVVREDSPACPAHQ